jgi:hypothetical protein
LYSFDESGQLTGLVSIGKFVLTTSVGITLAKKADVNYAVVENPWIGIVAKRLLQGKLSQLHTTLTNPTQENPGLRNFQPEEGNRV